MIHNKLFTMSNTVPGSSHMLVVVTPPGYLTMNLYDLKSSKFSGIVKNRDASTVPSGFLCKIYVTKRTVENLILIAYFTQQLQPISRLIECIGRLQGSTDTDCL